MLYKLRDKERSKESAYVLVGFLARPFVIFVSHIARYASSTPNRNLSLRNQKLPQPIFIKESRILNPIHQESW